MSGLIFLRVDGVTEMFDVVMAGESIGNVWQNAGQWYADEWSMSAPAICAATKEEAAQQLFARRNAN